MPLFTLADVRSRVYARLDNNTALYTTAEVDREINNSIISVNLFSGVLQISAAIVSVAGQYMYEIPASYGILYPIRIQFEGRPTRQMSLLALTRLYRDWATENTTVNYFPAHWAAIDIRTFVIHPRDMLGGREILITGVQEPPTIVNDGDFIPFEDSDMQLISDLAAYTLIFKEGATEFQRSVDMYKQFLREMRIKSKWNMQVNPRVYIPMKPSETQMEAPVSE